MRLNIDELDLVLCALEKDMNFVSSSLGNPDLKLGPRTKALYENNLTKLENVHTKLANSYLDQVAIRDRCKKEISA